MSEQDQTTETMRALRFHDYGEPFDVLQLQDAPVPEPGPDRIRVAVRAAGLNPADWELCRGFSPGELPRGVGCDVAGTVEAIGAGVTDVAVGDLVFGTADWRLCPSAGAADKAIMDEWFPVPDGLDPGAAAALPMVLGTAAIYLNALSVGPETTIFIYGAGGMVGFASVQVALRRGARVIAAAGETFAGRLREFGAEVTPYGEGMVERVAELAGGPIDVALDTARRAGVLPQLIEIVGGEQTRVMTIADFEAAAALGTRYTFGEDPKVLLAGRYSSLAEYAGLAAEGRFEIPIARSVPLADWREAVELSSSGHAHGKLLLIP